MSRILQPLPIEHPQELREIVMDGIDEIQKGAIVLDTNIGNEEYGYIDLVAANETKRGMLFFLNSSGQEVDFLGPFKCLNWFQENQNIFQKLYAGKIDFNYPPNILFIAPHFTPSIQKVLLNLKKGRVVLLKYNCFHDGQEMKIILEKIADSLEDEGKEDTPQLTGEACSNSHQEEVPPLTPQKPKIELDKFRQELSIDISNISDQELSELLE